MYSVEVTRYSIHIMNACTYWLEHVFGPSGEDWVVVFEEDEYNTIFVHFASLRNAELFKRHFERDYLSFDYEAWVNFCNSGAVRDKIEDMWERKGWRPKIAVLGYPHVHPKALGYKSYFHPVVQTWFFEHDVDIIMFYLEFGDGKGHNRH